VALKEFAEAINLAIADGQHQIVVGGWGGDFHGY